MTILDSNNVMWGQFCQIIQNVNSRVDGILNDQQPKEVERILIAYN